MKHYTENKTYNKYLFAIVHTYDVTALNNLLFDIACDTEIDTFDMVNELGDIIEARIAMFA